jgi:transglutaminase-like putative cysteine protease
VTRKAWLAIPLIVLAAAQPAVAQLRGPVLHEPVAFDPREDAALLLAGDGDMRPAIQTPRGLVPAPDPARPVGPGDAPYNTKNKPETDSTFRPDRNTQRPDVLPYDDPFSPSTAPFKRLTAYDQVDTAYNLTVRDARHYPLAINKVPEAQAFEDQFYADMVVDLQAGKRVKIPSVGPGTRVLSARAVAGTQDVRFSLYRDGADNWFIEGDTTIRARLVMELAIPRAAFGGDFGNPSRAELRQVPPLPSNVAAAAAQVASKIGVTRGAPPREIVAKLVTYFRSFTDSEEPPTARGDIYLDLALSQKGVCRHRAFAFLVTALHLGIETRMVVNEAHAWVEVHDGRLWRRIDLGGAGRTLHDPLSQNVPHDAPPDPFSWPQGSTRGDDLADRARRQGGGSSGGASPAPPSGATNPPAGQSSSGGASGAPGSSGGGPGSSGGFSSGGTSGGASGGMSSGGPTSNRTVGIQGPDDRPSSTISMTLPGAEAKRGSPFQIRGQVSADGEPCGHVTVEVVLKSNRTEIPIGMLATDERGAYDGAIVLPSTVPLGDYDVVARTLGDARCGRGHTR